MSKYIDQVNIKIKNQNPILHDIHARADLVTPGDITKLTVNGEVVDSGILDTDVEENIVDEEGYGELFNELFPYNGDNRDENETKLKSVLDNLADRAIDYYDRLGYLEYDSFKIASFSASKTSEELGNTTNVTLSWNISIPGDNRIPHAIKIKDNRSPSVTIDVDPADTSVVIDDVSSNRKWTLTAYLTETLSKDSSQVGITFTNRLYWGAKTEPSTYNSSFIKSLSSNKLSSNKSLGNISATLNSGEYFYVAIPKSYGTPTFEFGGNVVLFDQISNIEYNNNSYSAQYNIYKSPNSGGGSTTYKVS